MSQTKDLLAESYVEILTKRTSQDLGGEWTDAVSHPYSIDKSSTCITGDFEFIPLCVIVVVCLSHLLTYIYSNLIDVTG